MLGSLQYVEDCNFEQDTVLDFDEYQEASAMGTLIFSIFQELNNKRLKQPFSNRKFMI